MDKHADRDTSLYEKLYAYGRSDYAAFHMPGHKRQVKAAFLPEGLPWEIDITEIDGFDNLHHAEAILKDSMDRAALFYGTKKSLYSINGSTAGILSAIFAVTKTGDTILMGRNCHKSVYHAVFLRQLRPLYLYPQIDEETGIACGYRPQDVKNLLKKHPEIRAVILTSPTYEGVISDIRVIADLAHEAGIPLVVDEAHGAHLTVVGQKEQKRNPNEQINPNEQMTLNGQMTPNGRMTPNERINPQKTNDLLCESDEFPLSAVCLGADLVIQSLHKTLPALTQTAILHVCGDLVEEAEAARYMGIFQTSSPSYVLMASIDSCIRYMDSPEGQRVRTEYLRRLLALRSELKQYQRIHLPEPVDEKAEGEGMLLDPSKLVLSADGLSGKELYDILRETYHLQPEMCTGSYALLMTGMFDTEEMYDRLLRADEIEDRLLQQKLPQKKLRISLPEKPRQVYTPAETDLLAAEEVNLTDSVGRISAEYAYQYPPGIPLIVPGEEISGEVLEHLPAEKEAGLEIQGLRSMDGTRILVAAKDYK